MDAGQSSQRLILESVEAGQSTAIACFERFFHRFLRRKPRMAGEPILRVNELDVCFRAPIPVRQVRRMVRRACFFVYAVSGVRWARGRSL